MPTPGTRFDMRIRELLRVPEAFEPLDRVADPVGKRITRLTGAHPSAAGILQGRWLGHPVHPVVVAIPVGAWTAAVALETVLRDHAAARRLIVLGVAFVPLSVITGWSDWVQRDRTERRTGIVHAAGNTAATLAMLASLRQRRRGHRGRGEVCSVLGLTLATASGTLGGHIAFGRSGFPDDSESADEAGFAADAPFRVESV